MNETDQALIDKYLTNGAPAGFDGRADSSGVGFVPIAEFMAENDEPRNWLLSDLLPADGLAMVTAFSKVGKSTLARCLAVAVADPNRTEFLGREVATGTVLHLALEERTTTVKDHYRAIGHPPGIEVWCKPAADIAPTTEERIAKLAGDIERLKPALVIIDTLGKFAPMRGEELNHYSAVNNLLEPFRVLTHKHETLILFVHHSRKSGGEHGADALGSAALTAAMDTTLSITRNGSGRSYTATGRDGVETVSPIALSLSDDGWIDAAGTRAEVTYSNTRGKVWTVLYDASPHWLDRDAVIEATKPATQATVLSALNELLKCGDVEKTGKGVKGDPTKYRANPDIP